MADERSAITDWLSSHTRSPKNNTELEHTHLCPNFVLRTKIEEYANDALPASARMRKRCKKLGAVPPALSFDEVAMDLLAQHA